MSIIPGAVAGASSCGSDLHAQNSNLFKAQARLLRFGYDRSIVRRLLRRDPELALKIANDPQGEPIRLHTVFTETRWGFIKPLRNKFVYRGLTVDPWRYDPHFNPIHAHDRFIENDIWIGRLSMARGYAQLPRKAGGYPAGPDGKQKLTMVLEMQIPLFAQLTDEKIGEAYSRLIIPDDTLFIRRVGIINWSPPSTTEGLDPKFYDYETIFDDAGHVRSPLPF